MTGTAASTRCCSATSTDLLGCSRSVVGRRGKVSHAPGLATAHHVALNDRLSGWLVHFPGYDRYVEMSRDGKGSLPRGHILCGTAEAIILRIWPRNCSGPDIFSVPPEWRSCLLPYVQMPRRAPSKPLRSKTDGRVRLCHRTSPPHDRSLARGMHPKDGYMRRS